MFSVSFQAGFFGQNLYRPFSLAEKVQKFQPLRTGNRLSDASELLIDRIFKNPIRISHLINLKYSVD